MKTFNRSYLPDMIEYKGKSYFLDLEKTNSKVKQVYFDATQSLQINVLSRKVKGKLDLYGMPYKPSIFIFTTI